MCAHWQYISKSVLGTQKYHTRWNNTRICQCIYSLPLITWSFRWLQAAPKRWFCYFSFLACQSFCLFYADFDLTFQIFALLCVLFCTLYSWIKKYWPCKYSKILASQQWISSIFRAHYFYIHTYLLLTYLGRYPARASLTYLFQTPRSIIAAVIYSMLLSPVSSWCCRCNQLVSFFCLLFLP